MALSCVAGERERTRALEAALADLAAAGFAFEADVAFRSDRYTVCESLACADLALERGRRTVRVAPEAFDSPARLRAALLEIWGRYERPAPPSPAGQARAALWILREGGSAGIDDAAFLRRTHHVYAQLYARLSAAERAGLPHPDALPYP